MNINDSFGDQHSSQHSNTSFIEAANMSELRYPNESREYRDARESLLKDEQELIDKVRSVAEKRRKLPPGGQFAARRSSATKQVGLFQQLC